MVTNKKENLKVELDLLQREIEECRIQYELHFSGVEPRPPISLRDRVQRKLRQIQLNVRSSTDRFRLNSLNHKFTSLKQYWDRVNFERENGTYHKDKMRLRRRMLNKKALSERASDSKSSNKPAVYTIQDLLDAEKTAEEKTTNQSASAQKESQQTENTKHSGIAEDRMKTIYNTYVHTIKKRNESTSNVTFEAIQKSLNKQAAKLEAKGYKNVDFKVIIKNGKTTFQAVAKKTK